MTVFQRGLLLVLMVALIGRVLILASGSVSFHSDEAVVALMARHILQGDRPTFFYGQAYMGSLDAWVVAFSFALFGQSVLALRLAQAALYLGIVAIGYAVAWRFASPPHQTRLAAFTGLILAVPPVLVALYTTATLGGYNETLLLGGLALLLGWDVTHGKERSAPRWFALGLLVGLGWWTNALIVAFAAPLALFMLWRLRDRLLRLLPYIALAALAFVIGSLPWWAFNLEHDWAALRFLIGADASGDYAGTDVFTLPLPERLIGLFLIGTPALLGLRFPWLPSYFAPAVGIGAAAFAVLALVQLVRPPKQAALHPEARALIAALFGFFALMYLASRFSFDPTGRYFLPLALPLALAVSALAVSLRRLGVLLLLGLLAYHAAGQISAASTDPPGITTQFNLETHIPNEHDAELIAFLERSGIRYSYTNYWVSFRLSFLSAERLVFSAALPYKSDLSYTPLDERYPAYRAAVDGAPLEQIGVINTLPAVGDYLEARWAEQGITYRKDRLGAYTVYHEFSERPAL